MPKRRGVDWLTIILVGCFALMTWFFLPGNRDRWTRYPQQIKQYAERYSWESHSQYGEEWLIRDFFEDRRGGMFVDVGANHYRHFSNTYYLETALGWSGLAVEPQTRFAEGYRQHRPATRFRPFFVSDKSDEHATLFVLDHNPLVTSADASFTERFGSGAKALTTPTITLDDLLAADGVDRFDFLNMDIETWEPRALTGFDIQRFKPSLVCIEAHPEVIQDIFNYFAANGYVTVGKYLHADRHNLYFSPFEHMTTTAARPDSRDDVGASVPDAAR